VTPSPESISNPVSKPETNKEMLWRQKRIQIDKGRENFPRERIIKEAQFNPISKPCKLGYMMCKIKLYIIKYQRFINT
jgi:hypothetical protein